MKIDLHTHCLPVSRCAHHEPELLPQIFKDAKMDGFVLTNHCYPYHNDPLGDSFEKQAKVYVDVFHRCKNAGDKVGIKVFFGVELKLINEPNAPEFLLYGISEQDFLDTFPLYNETQKSVFDFCNEKDVLMVQAHPLRSEHGCKPADMRYMHGIEVFNAHPRVINRFKETLKLAEQNQKLKTSGTDFHELIQAGSGGAIVPDEITDQFMLRDYLKIGKIQIFDKNGIIYQNI